jgi:hypothetical protein
MRRRTSPDQSTNATAPSASASLPVGQAGADGYRAFALTLVAKPGSDPIKAIRALLKIALRRFELRCIDVHEVQT